MAPEKCHRKKVNQANENIRNDDKLCRVALRIPNAGTAVDCDQNENFVPSVQKDLGGAGGTHGMVESEPVESTRKESNNKAVLDDLSNKDSCVDLIGGFTNATDNPYTKDFSAVENAVDDMTGMNDEKSVVNTEAETLKVMETLNIDSCTLAKLTKRTATATATARLIMRFKYPDPPMGFKLSDVDKTFADAVVVFSMHCHPNDKSTRSSVRRAMVNYFALNSHKKRRKQAALNPHADQQ
ncbi:unnamed protein product [Adineta ricciae]|uniref:BEN domain-containing protein n=1 Tax=Adineta ricciae TaxID=249248 RepID=A0A815SRP3_ADIRI|nr:unnamed protein product [Adineta ricciae]